MKHLRGFVYLRYNDIRFAFENLKFNSQVRIIDMIGLNTNLKSFFKIVREKLLNYKNSTVSMSTICHLNI